MSGRAESVALRSPAGARSVAVLLAAVVLVALAVAIVPLAYAAHETGRRRLPDRVRSRVRGRRGHRRAPSAAQPVGWILLGVALLVGGSFDVETYSYLIYHVGDHGLPLGRVAVALAPCWYPGLVLLPAPDPSLSRRPAAVAALALGALAVRRERRGHPRDRRLARRPRAPRPPHPRRLVGAAPDDRQPEGWESAVLHGSLLLFLTLSLVFVLRQVLEFRRSTGIARQQLKSMLAGGGVLSCRTVSVGRCSAGVCRALLVRRQQRRISRVNALPIGIGVGILRYRLYEIDRLISRTLSYAVLTAALVAVFVGVVAVTTRVLPFSSPVAVAASTLAAAALFNPLRLRVQRLVDRRFNRARYDAEAIVAAFTARLQDAVDLETVRADLLSAVAQRSAGARVGLDPAAARRPLAGPTTSTPSAKTTVPSASIVASAMMPSTWIAARLSPP